MSTTTKRCKAMRCWDGRWPRNMQCFNIAKRDGYCGIHHPEAVAAREEKRKKRNAQYADSRRAFAYPKLVAALKNCINGMPHNPPQDDAKAVLRELGELP